jgi:hypothetical protein
MLPTLQIYNEQTDVRAVRKVDFAGHIHHRVLLLVAHRSGSNDQKVEVGIRRGLVSGHRDMDNELAADLTLLFHLAVSVLLVLLALYRIVQKGSRSENHKDILFMQSSSIF